VAIVSMVDRRIVRCEGLLESRIPYPLIEGYTAIFAFHTGEMVLLSQSDCVLVDEWPEESVEIPTDLADGEVDIIGSTITDMIQTNSATGVTRQLWLVLNSQYILGLVNTQRGTRLLTEPLLTAPVMRASPDLWDLNDNHISLEQLLLPE
jgi:hypothetical protein